MIEHERIQISLPPLIVLQLLRTDILANRSCLEMMTEDGGGRRRAGNKMELVIPFIIPILNQLGQFKHCDMTMMVILMLDGWWSGGAFLHVVKITEIRSKSMACN